MADRSLDWSRAEVDPAGHLTVPLTGPQNPIWNQAFNDQAARFDSETRGQTWGRIYVQTGFDEDVVTVTQVDDETSREQLRTDVDRLVSLAGQNVERDRGRRQDEEAQAARDEQNAEERSRRLTDRFREPPE